MLPSRIDLKSYPKGLCNQEVERGHTKKPQIPYILVEDKIGKKVKREPRILKVEIDDKTAVNASVWTGGGDESFLVHVM